MVSLVGDSFLINDSRIYWYSTLKILSLKAKKSSGSLFMETLSFKNSSRGALSLSRHTEKAVR